MILILSLEYDYSTSKVIKWLNYYNQPYIRINKDDEVILESLTCDNLVFTYNNQKYSLKDINSIWYRRGDFNIHSLPFKLEGQMLKGYNAEEITIITTYIHNLFKQKKSINNKNTVEVNKLEILRYCRTHGLNDADFIVTQSKKDLINFYNKHNKEIISKPSNNPYVLHAENKTYTTYTYLLKEEDVENLPDIFTPTFFQQQLHKKYEIRTFYLDGEFYSMAIFSQKNPRTEIDFRQYDWDKPNRVTPFRLPEWYRNKVTSMFQHYEINCASIDTIITSKDQYYMLDVNPIGQFGMTSTPCNYNLERKIAKYLI